MFEALSSKIQGILGKVGKRNRLTEKDVEEALREIRIALLEADVNLQVVRQFVDQVRQRLVGAQVSGGLTPTQEVIKSVAAQLQEMLGEESKGIEFSPTPPTIIMMVGLQGSGKTTTAAKLAKLLKSKGKSPLLVAADVYRPAAIEQLKQLGNSIGVPVVSGDEKHPVEIAREAIREAKSKLRDVVLIDTAGRLHIDEPLMEELTKIKKAVGPHEIFFVADAMAGQDVANVAKSFDDRIGITGVVLTKMDGDARGGAALSIKGITGKNIKFVGVGEKIDQIEPFYPDRLASRILGMGDMLSLIEKAEQAFDAQEAEKMQKRMLEGTITLEDLRKQIEGLRKMGSMENILEMIPGMGNMKSALSNAQFNEKELAHMEAVILSMTPQERIKPSIITGSRKRRIAKGSGTSVQMVNRVLKQHAQMVKMMKGLKKGKRGKKKGFMKGLPFGDDLMSMFGG